MPAVESRAIVSVDHDAESGTLFVRFVDGDLYAYFDMPAEVYKTFLTADSKGRFFTERIRPAYDFHPVREVRPPRD